MCAQQRLPAEAEERKTPKAQLSKQLGLLRHHRHLHFRRHCLAERWMLDWPEIKGAWVLVQRRLPCRYGIMVGRVFKYTAAPQDTSTQGAASFTVALK